MKYLYNIFIYTAVPLIEIASWFSLKLTAWSMGRRGWRKKLTQKVSRLDPDKKTVWFHAASLGEFEQGRPLMEKLKVERPDINIVLTFFSPSGYEVQKEYPHADIVCYLPLDTPRNARDFVSILHPDAVVFIKYEFWPNYIDVISKKDIPLFVVSAIFKRNQVFFRPYGGMMRRALRRFTHLFVQDTHSKALLKTINIENVSVAGDTRFDRVCEITERDNRLSFMDDFKGNRFCLVAGSSWPEDEKLLACLINSKAQDQDTCFVIAPHNIIESRIENLIQLLQVPTVRYTRLTEDILGRYKVLILDTVGILTKVYSYAHIAYIGGAFGHDGVHNVLEPAVFGTPVLCGPNIKKYAEAKGLHKNDGLFIIEDTARLQQIYDKLRTEEAYLEFCSHRAAEFVLSGKGSSEKILHKIHSYL